MAALGLLALGVLSSPALAVDARTPARVKTEKLTTSVASDGSRYVTWSATDPERKADSLAPVTILDVSTGRQRTVPLPEGCVQGVGHGAASSGRMIVSCAGTEQFLMLLSSGELRRIGASFAGYATARIGKAWALGQAPCGSALCLIFENLRTGATITKPTGSTAWNLDAEPLRPLRVCGSSAAAAGFDTRPWLAGDLRLSAAAFADRGALTLLRCGRPPRTLDQHVQSVQVGTGMVTWSTTCLTDPLEPPIPRCHPLVKVERLRSRHRFVWRLPGAPADADIEAIQIKNWVFVQRILSTAKGGSPTSIALFKARIPGAPR